MKTKRFNWNGWVEPQNNQAVECDIYAAGDKGWIYRGRTNKGQIVFLDEKEIKKQ